MQLPLRDGLLLPKVLNGSSRPRKRKIIVHFGNYKFTSDIPGFEVQEGQYVSVNPWPGDKTEADIPLGNDWYGDNPDPKLFFGVQQGARTVSKWRKEFLGDWANRWEWLR